MGEKQAFPMATKRAHPTVDGLFSHHIKAVFVSIGVNLV
jgi:hypothetical protein